MASVNLLLASVIRAVHIPSGSLSRENSSNFTQSGKYEESRTEKRDVLILTKKIRTTKVPKKCVCNVPVSNSRKVHFL